MNAKATDYHVASRFSNLEYKAQLALEELQEFWADLYGQNEALRDAFNAVEAMREEFESRTQVNKTP